MRFVDRVGHKGVRDELIARHIARPGFRKGADQCEQDGTSRERDTASRTTNRAPAAIHDEVPGGEQLLDFFQANRANHTGCDETRRWRGQRPTSSVDLGDQGWNAGRDGGSVSAVECERSFRDSNPPEREFSTGEFGPGEKRRRHRRAGNVHRRKRPLSGLQFADQQMAARRNEAGVERIRAVTERVEHLRGGLELLHAPGQIARRQGNLRFSDLTAGLGEAFTSSECARGAAQKLARPLVVSQLSHRNAAQSERRRVITQRNTFECTKRITSRQQARSGDNEGVHGRTVFSGRSDGKTAGSLLTLATSALFQLLICNHNVISFEFVVGTNEPSGGVRSQPPQFPMKILPLVACVLLISNSAFADWLYLLDFESPTHQVGESPTVGPRPYSISRIPFGTPRIVNDQPLLDGNCLELKGGDVYDQVMLDTGWMSGLFTIEYDVVTSGLTNSKYGFTVLLDIPGNVHSVGFDGRSNTFSKDVPYAGGQPLPFEDNRRYHVSIEADSSGGEWTIRVDGVERYRSSFKGSAIGSIRLNVGSGVGNVPATPGTKVYVDNFRVYQTSVLPPLIKDVEAMSVDSKSGQLVARVNPRGQATSATVSYRNPSGSETVVAGRFLGSGRDYVLLSFPIDSLTPNSEYGFKIFAKNDSGASHAEALFTTRSADYSGPIARSDSLHTPSATESFTVPVRINDVDPGQASTIRLPDLREAGYNPYVTTDGSTITFRPPRPPEWWAPSLRTILFDGNTNFSYFLTVDGVDVSKAIVSLSNSQPWANDIYVNIDDLTQPVVVDLFSRIGDEDQDPLTAALHSHPSTGSAWTNARNQLIYYPSENFLGWDSFTYRVTDGRGGWAFGTVNVLFSRTQKRLLHLTGHSSEQKSFGIPSIFFGGREAGWLATVRSPDRFKAIFSGPLGSPEMRRRVGDVVPSSFAPQAILTHIDDPVFDVYAVSFAFRGRVQRYKSKGHIGDRWSGIWTDSGYPTLVAEEGGPAPGGGRFKQFQALAMPGYPALFFSATLRTGSDGITAKSDRGLWLWKGGSGTLQKVLGEG